MFMDKEGRMWAMALHLSVFAGYAIPFAGLVAPIIIWQVKKNEIPEIDVHGRIVANWILSSVIYLIGCIILSLVGIGVLLGFALFAVGIIFPIIGAVKASSGEAWKYPLSIQFF